MRLLIIQFNILHLNKLQTRVGIYLVDVSENQVKILAIAVRGNSKPTAKLKKLINKVYNLNIRRY